MMSLRSPGFLAALLLAAIPVALYLLFRLRRREVRWGASYVLDMTLRTSRKESRWRQYVVLAVRTLMLILLALAFCAPLVSGGRGFGGTFPRGGSGTLARVILLDNSGSMEAEYGGATRYAEARRLAGRLQSAAACGRRTGGRPRTSRRRTASVRCMRGLARWKCSRKRATPRARSRASGR